MADEIGTVDSVICRWVKKYNAFGESAFDELKSNNAYTKEFKQRVVDAYLNGEGSLNDLAIKYNVSSKTTILKWVNDYNSHIELKDYIPGGEDIYMAKSRKVTKEERIEIVKYCIEHDMDYKITAKVFETTYANVFNWVKKYKEKGEESLGDKRGHHKTDEEVDEVTLLKRQLKQKEHELEMVQLEVRPKKVGRNRKEEVYRTSKYEAEYETIKETIEEEINKGKTPNISLMCRILGVKRANDYKWLHHEKSVIDKENEETAELIKKYHKKWFYVNISD